MRSSAPPQESNVKYQLVAVAVDNDKNSQFALKWAADHIISRGQKFHLVHVRRKINSIPTPAGYSLPISEVDEEVAADFLEQRETQTKEILLPFKCFSKKRGLQCKEIILEDADIPKAIIEYVKNQFVDRLVLGASSRNAFTRTFKGTDVPTCVSKNAPETCSLYVISKGKIQSIRPAPHPNTHPVKRQLSGRYESGNENSFQSTTSSIQSPANSFQSATTSFESATSPSFGVGTTDKQPFEDAIKSPFERSSQIRQDYGRRLPARNYDNMINRDNQIGEHVHFSYQSSCSSTGRGSIDNVGRGSIDHVGRGTIDRPGNQPLRDHPDKGVRQLRMLNMRDFDEHSFPDEKIRSSESSRSGLTYWSNGYGSSGNGSLVSQEGGGSSSSAHSLEDMDAEMRRLKLGLQQRMDMYSTACKEPSAKQKPTDLHSWRIKDERLKHEARIAGELAMTLAEEEQGSRTILEVAEAARKVAEIEINKRLIADRKLLQDAEEKRKACLVAEACYKRYTKEEIEMATDGFSDALKVGEGGYGPVFKSYLDHTIVAIKILRSDAKQGMKQFQQEIEVLSRIHHPNMVLLMGACPDYGCLVYEYMANGSLEDCLFLRGNTPPLSWQLRFKIAMEIATGLLYLHQSKPEPLVHRDLKPANILLDHNFVSKIGDVGLARLIPQSISDTTTQYRMTAAAGTFCYIDPEYQQTGMLGIKSDIYALGIILLQIITAKPPMGLAHNMEMEIEKGGFVKMLDPLVPDWPVQETLTFAKLALKCTELRKKDRPDLATVLLPELNRLSAIADEKKTGGIVPSLVFAHPNHTHAFSFQEASKGHPLGQSGFLTDDGSDRIHATMIETRRTGMSFR